MNGALLNERTRVRCVDHHAAADIDAAMMVVRADVARLRIGNARPAHEGVGGANTHTVGTGETIADKSGAVKGIGSASAPRIRLSNLGIRAIDHDITGDSLRFTIVDGAAT